MEKPSKKELIIVRLSLVGALILGIAGYYVYQNMPDTPTFAVKFETTAGDFVIAFYSGWSPNGVRRVRELVEAGYYDDCRFFRVVPKFVVQWGMNGDPHVNARWAKNTILDDPIKQPNIRGHVSFATPGRPNSRGTQLFINLNDKNQKSLDKQGFSPVGKVIEGMDVVDSIYSEYREGPDQQAIESSGNEYLKGAFPKLDYIKKARIVKAD